MPPLPKKECILAACRPYNRALVLRYVPFCAYAAGAPRVRQSNRPTKERRPLVDGGLLVEEEVLPAADAAAHGVAEERVCAEARREVDVLRNVPRDELRGEAHLPVLPERELQHGDFVREGHHGDAGGEGLEGRDAGAQRVGAASSTTERSAACGMRGTNASRRHSAAPPGPSCPTALLLLLLLLLPFSSRCPR